MSYFTKEERSTLKNIIEKKEPNTEDDENSEDLISCCTFKFRNKPPKVLKSGKEVVDEKYENIKSSTTFSELNDCGGSFSDIVGAIKGNLISIKSVIDDDNTVMNGIIESAKERYDIVIKDKENTKSRDAAIKAIHKAESFYAMEAAKDAMKLWIRLEQTYLDSKKSKRKIIKSIPNHAKKILKDMHNKQKEEKKEAMKAEKEAKKAEKEAKKAEKEAKKAEKEAKKAEKEAKKAEKEEDSDEDNNSTATAEEDNNSEKDDNSVKNDSSEKDVDSDDEECDDSVKFSEEAVKNMKLKEIKEHLKSLSIDVKGNKSVLSERLVNFYKS